MPEKIDHIIQNQSIEIEFENLEHAMGVQNEIAEIFYERIQPQMAVLFDELFGKNYYASIDKLEIDCGLLNKKNWEQELTERALRKLKEELVQINKKENDFEKIEHLNAAKTFLFFLENGHLPWNKRIDTIAELEELLIINENLLSQLKKLIEQQSRVAERLVNQFSKKFTEKIIAEISKSRKNESDEIYSIVEKLNLIAIDKYIINVALLKAFAFDENKKSRQEFVAYLLTMAEEKTALNSQIKEILKNEKSKQESNSLVKDEKEKKSEIKDTPHKEEKLFETIYINNAGLVLLHPFLQILFGHLKLTEENKWRNIHAQHKAILILEFLATGNEEFEEFRLVLNKILCGIDINEVVETKQELSEEIRDECESLLNNVITHWAVLKNTTPAGLREGFLLREGKLSKVDNGWLLQVEQKAIDVLLSHLPWGIGFIKLPWMEEMLFVEWA